MLQILLLGIGGIIVGIVAGLLGLGGGVLLVPLLAFAFKLDIHTAIGTSLLVIVPTALCSAMTHWHLGNISVKSALAIAVFTIIGGFLGAHLAVYLPSSVLKKIFAIFMLVIAIKMFLGK